MVFESLQNDLSVCRLHDLSNVRMTGDAPCFLGMTADEISLVCETASAPEDCDAREDGWKAFRVQGTLAFSLTGILSEITGILAKEKIGVFAVSTFNTDYVLVKAENFKRAMLALVGAGHSFAAD